MKIVVLYHPESDHNRAIVDFARDFKVIKTRSAELVSLETKEGAEKAKLYDIMEYPAILILDNNGQLVKNWQGMPLPLMDEVISYSG